MSVEPQCIYCNYSDKYRCTTDEEAQKCARWKDLQDLKSRIGDRKNKKISMKITLLDSSGAEIHVESGEVDDVPHIGISRRNGSVRIPLEDARDVINLINEVLKGVKIGGNYR